MSEADKLIEEKDKLCGKDTTIKGRANTTEKRETNSVLNTVHCVVFDRGACCVV